ncbi:MAG: hypothetical protein B7X39_17825 [Lysobacterales bacterium 14-68-21]|jgi:uncharacterized protein involved in outer membrane biogenesis|nr:MAG: hypothetical protein B7X45_16340 [Xanthomonadales bacterium 15-68-25]OZB64087.1 MAG: hypothetical protein B7X39_17825 [Xanthomonadales bacterium 14-68-21]
MRIRRLLEDPRAARALDRTRELARSRRTRRTLAIVAAVLVLFGLLGFFAAPPILRGQIEKRASAALSRPVTVGAVHFNPFTLRLQLDRLHIGSRDGKTAFVDVDEAVINASWTSLFRMAPVLDALRLDHPQLHLARSADGRFNFSDLIDRYAAKPGAPPSPPARFALANIQVHNGDIRFDDQRTRASHRIDQLDVGIPFLANLPSDTDIYVQPLLAMRVDGSPLRIDGQTKPFADSRESIMHFQFDKLDLPRYLAYVPAAALPVSIPKGLLSGVLDLHFVQSQPTPQLKLTGHLQLDSFALATRQGAPILDLGHGGAQLLDVQPLASRYHLGTVVLDHAALSYRQSADGHSNFDALTAGTPAAADKTPTDLRIDGLFLTDGAVHYTNATQQTLDLSRVRGALHGLSLLKAPAGTLNLAAALGGGDITARGTLDLAAGQLKAALGLKQVAVAPLQAIAAPDLRAPVTQGRLDAGGQLALDWGKAVNVHLTDAHATVSDFALAPQQQGRGPAMAWGRLDAAIPLFDLASRQVQLGDVTVHRPALDVERARNGKLSLMELLPETPAAPKGASSPAAPWHWQLGRLALDDGSVDFTDLAAGTRPVKTKLTAMKGHLDGLSDKLGEARPFALAGTIDRGSFDASGTLRPDPLGAELKLTTRNLDIARFVPYLDVPLNVTVASARLTSDGKLRYDARGRTPSLRYQGNAALERVRVQDKLTGDDFLRWRTLTASRLSAEIGPSTPRVDVGALVLTSFYARVIINADGRLNLADVVASPASAPVSVTRAEGSVPTPAANAPTPPPAASTAVAQVPAPASSAAPAADIHLGGITLVNGQLNYTDNFIKPNYTANLTKLTGKIGAFGTKPGDPPADLTVQAALDENSPVDINGTINPLQPVAFLDIKGKADEVELTRLAAYSRKYAGYPITSGKLNMDVHYQLDNRKLEADNHIFITQLTFGDRDNSPGVKHLPVKLAVALLRDTEGNIDVNLPVSGSLDDPQFSVGGLVWRAIVNLVAKAVTAPFRLLGAAFGGAGADLGYVEFAPGSAILDAKAQERLGKLVAILQKKPSLKLDIIGRVDPTKDRDGLRKVTVENLIRRELVLDEKGKDADVSDTALADVRVTPDQVEKYLKRAYRHDDIPNKPRNFLGLKKSLDPDEMRGLMEANVAVDEPAMRALAKRRADAVRSWLTGKLDASRYDEKPVVLDAKGIDDKGKTTRVDFGLHQ